MTVTTGVCELLKESPDFISAEQLTKAFVGIYQGQPVFIYLGVKEGKNRGRKKRKKRS